jgi:hypothetical protein
VVANVGDLEGELAFRPEALAFFHLNPFKVRGVAPYVGGGVAGVFGADQSRGYIVALAGVEWRPGTPRGWFAEVGVGGGVRASVGRVTGAQAACGKRSGQLVAPTSGSWRLTGRQYCSPTLLIASSSLFDNVMYRSARYSIVSSNQSR